MRSSPEGPSSVLRCSTTGQTGSGPPKARCLHFYEVNASFLRVQPHLGTILSTGFIAEASPLVLRGFIFRRQYAQPSVNTREKKHTHPKARYIPLLRQECLVFACTATSRSPIEHWINAWILENQARYPHMRELWLYSLFAFLLQDRLLWATRGRGPPTLQKVSRRNGRSAVMYGRRLRASFKIDERFLAG